MTEVGAEARLEVTGAGAEQLERVPGECRLEAGADVDLVDVAGADVLDGARHGHEVRFGYRAGEKRTAGELAPSPSRLAAAALPF